MLRWLLEKKPKTPSHLGMEGARAARPVSTGTLHEPVSPLPPQRRSQPCPLSGETREASPAHPIIRMGFLKEFSFRGYSLYPASLSCVPRAEVGALVGARRPRGFAGQGGKDHPPLASPSLLMTGG